MYSLITPVLDKLFKWKSKRMKLLVETIKHFLANIFLSEMNIRETDIVNLRIRVHQKVHIV